MCRCRECVHRASDRDNKKSRFTLKRFAHANCASAYMRNSHNSETLFADWITWIEKNEAKKTTRRKGTEMQQALQDGSATKKIETTE